jgi:hypothetical protein
MLPVQSILPEAQIKCCTCLRRLAASQRPLSKGGKAVMTENEGPGHARDPHCPALFCYTACSMVSISPYFSHIALFSISPRPYMTCRQEMAII